MAKLEYARMQFQLYQARALYWQSMATTGAAARRNISIGSMYNGTYRELTDAEKTDDALQKSLTFLQLMSETMDRIFELTEGI